MRIGTTYFGSNYTASAPESDWRRDFAEFKAKGVTVICIIHRWNQIETTRGAYNDTGMTRVRNMVRVANEYGIKAYLNIHTWYTGGGVPAYVGNLEMLFPAFNPNYADLRQGFYDMLQWYINFFDDEPNVAGYMLFNEPVNADWGIPAGADQWSDLFRGAYTAARRITGKPLSARYAANTDLGFNDDIFTIWDYLCLNIYLDKYAGHTQETMKRFISKAKAAGKTVYISEMGMNTSNSDDQAAEYSRVLPIFNAAGINTVFGWWWSSGAGPDGAGATNVGFQLRGRPAFDILASYSTPTPTPSVALPIIMIGAGLTMNNPLIGIPILLTGAGIYYLQRRG